MFHTNSQPARDENIVAIVDYFKSGIKQSCMAVGIELEHTLVHSDGTPVEYGDNFGQRSILEAMTNQYDNKILTSEGNFIGLSRSGESITLEPGSQVEISAGPFKSLQDAKNCLNDFESRLEKAVEGHNIDILTPGYHPTRKASDLKLLPKRRYKFMNEYLGAISMYGICMMRGSASTQVAIDYNSVEDCLRKLKLAFSIVPILSLICDNSPIFEANIRPHQLVRTEIWNKCDPDRCTLVPGVMKDDFTLEKYAQYILDTPAIVEIVDGRDEFSTKTFGDIFADKAMTESDIEHALSMFFTDVRLKRYIEIRPADAMPPQYVIAYAALIKGLFCFERSLDALDSLFNNISELDTKTAKSALMQNGYSATVYDSPVAELADELISIAVSALNDEEKTLIAPIANIVAQRKTLADIAIEQMFD